MEDLFERVRNAPIRWVSVEDELPEQWYNHWAWSCSKLEDFRFKIKLSDGKEFWSYWVDGGWKITKMNPKFVVTHWVKPFRIA
jgi:hypothetical protein